MRSAHALALAVVAALLLVGARCGPGAGPPLLHDRDALQQMVDAAGPGATVRFPPGVHVICKALKPLAGQTWELDGAVLQRCSAAVSWLLQDAHAGATSVRLADPSRFLLGQRVTPVSAPDRSGGEAQAAQHIVLGIAGDTLTFTNPLSRRYRAGDLFITIEPIVQPAPQVDGFTLRGGTIDGNRRANPFFVAWEVAYSVNLRGGRNLLIEDVLFRDCWGDCVKAGAQDSTVRRTIFDGGSTAAIHLSLASNLLVESSVFRNLNRDARMAGHSEGAVTWSARNRDITLQGVCIEDIPSDQAEGALASTNLYWNRGISVYDSRFCRVPAIWKGYLSAEPLPDFAPTGFVEIERNVAVVAGHSTVTVSPSVVSPVVGLVFSGNLLVGSTYDWSSTLAPQVQGNVSVPGPAPCSCDGWIGP